MIPYPTIDPVALHLGPLAVRWYGIAYLLGFLSAYAILRHAVSRGRLALPREGVGDLLTTLVVGVILGGRLGYVLFYNLPYFLQHPLHAFAVWEGGMSFHGGLAGVAVAAWLFSRRKRLPLRELGDALALATPPGLFFGRIANFINGELYGRPADVPWAMVFPDAGALPRHPSQLYEAVLEGLLLWVVVWGAGRLWRDRRGVPTGAFVCGYGLIRFLVEFTRQPDPQLGLILGPFSMGQVLSAAMVLVGATLLGTATPVRPR
ncbi:MAG: prolipoprotein diacylglyceryl transferase [Deferrisomatales bacterium]|nr:prolipoprotein diacylglyceryl transferase [Deferrisomatales bacterium]